MQQTSSSSSRHARADRTTTSCTECRRRKQKCNQTQPCNNCSRRFPQPKCEYIHKNPNGRQQTQGLPNMSVFAAEIDPGSSDATTPGSSQAVARRQGSSSTSSDVRRSGTLGRGARQSDVKQEEEESTASEPRLQQPSRSPGNPWAAPVANESASNANLWLLSDSLADFSYLPMKPTKLNALLVKTFVHHLYRFKGSYDHPDLDNPFITVYAPWCFQSKLLNPVAISVAAQSLALLRKIDPAVAMAYKVQAIQTLNAHLRSPAAASDEAVSAVSQMLLNDWYFGDTRDMEAHSRGLRELVRLRGGFDNLGADIRGVVSKMALVNDCLIAISLETKPLSQDAFLLPGPEFVLHEPPPEKLNLSYNTPFLSQSRYPSFARSESLKLHPSTARILDDMRFLFSLILKLPSEPTQDDLDKVQHTAKWVHDRIESLPDICPDAPRSAPPVATALSSQTPSSTHSASTPDSVPSQATDSPPSVVSTASSYSSRGPIIPQSHDPSHLLLHNPPASQPVHHPDFLYATVRQTALLYARAAAGRTKLSTACPVPLFYLIWSTAARVSQREWYRVFGVWAWVAVALVTPSATTPFTTVVRSMLMHATVQMGLDHWEVTMEMLRAAVRVVGWLAGGKDGIVL